VASEVVKARFVNRLRELWKDYDNVSRRQKLVPSYLGPFVVGLGVLFFASTLVLAFALGNEKDTHLGGAVVTGAVFGILSCGIGLGLWLYTQKTEALKETLPAKASDIVQEFPGLAQSIGGARTLQDPDAILESILVLAHGVGELYLENRRARKPLKTVAHEGHVVEIAGTEAAVRFFHDGNPMVVRCPDEKPSPGLLKLLFDAQENGETVHYEITKPVSHAWASATILRNGLPVDFV
jgi:hypothetical protein